MILRPLGVTPAFGTDYAGGFVSKFRRGDVDANSRLNVQDAIAVFLFICRDAPPPPCEDAADIDDDGKLDVTDGIDLLSHLFLPVDPLPPPASRCGFDPTADALGCVVSSCRQDCPPRRASWALRMGGLGSEDVSDLAGLPDGSAVVTGSIGRFASFSSLDEACPAELGNVNPGFFVARYSACGQLEWAAFGGGSGRDESSDIAALPDGSSFVTGTISHLSTLGSGEPGETQLRSLAGTQDAFIASYAADGTLRWVGQAASEHFAWGEAIAVLPDGACLATGHFIGDVIFASGEANETRLTGVDAPDERIPGWRKTDGFVAHYRPDGRLAWARHLGGKDADSCRDIAGMVDGGAVVVGSFDGGLNLGEGRDAVNLVSRGSSDGFITRFRPDGSVAWATQVAGESGISVSAVKVRDESSFLVIGSAYARTGELGITFAPGGPDEIQLPHSRAFLALYDLRGTLQWARRIAEQGALEVTPSLGAVVVGTLSDPTTFGQGLPGERTLTPSGKVNLFAAGYDRGGEFAWAEVALSRGYQIPRAISLGPDGQLLVTGRFTETLSLFQKAPNATTLEPRESSDLFLARFESARLTAGELGECSAENPSGACPAGSICRDGVCQALVCASDADEFRCGSGRSFSNLAGVQIVFPEQPCQWTLDEVRQGVDFEYHILIETDVADVQSLLSPREACGAPPPASGLSVFELISGGEQRYCLCDVGLCFRRPREAVTLKAGITVARFHWEGLNWTGPSDFCNPPGPAFPPGQYRVTVRATGTTRVDEGEEPFEVFGSFGFELLAD